ncbi:methyltransferase [Photobacterium aquimaris]|uniref:Methyltransferase domain-containing protein n=1 Tax=Photobacterium aquimaris TaxID=512643 RepID=A0A2T3IGF8_9GAMM|nr:MerR family transcriptional regulator [Photobacterium aquimaris]OBU16391.1 methyltransferase [Photobacterium aquimaris]OBU21495.1 methyltransferase [Photobacterium aquimaris]PSU26059.1 methyltransferase domain-containing protein [Photobacterium aquimaris]PSW02203.1 methyltransferase domain-containing protein [Photobacterium aquimaris]
MYHISELAQRVNLSRSTLLYYEKLGLIKAKRQTNGYRYYSDNDLQRIRLLQQLQAGGLTLKECQSCLDGKINRDMLMDRLQVLEQEIATKQHAKQLLSSMLGMNASCNWHETIERTAPLAHLEWLKQQGFNEKEALRLKWLSKNINEHEQYMADFESIFYGLDRLGPSDDDDSLQALHALPINTGNALDVGCGKGLTTCLLAHHSDFSLTALDNDEYHLSCLKEKIKHQPINERITTRCSSMMAMPFEEQQFDVIWAEGSAYIMGVNNALKQWQRFLKPHGYVVISDLVWLTETPSIEAYEFWQKNYPDMTSKQQRTTDIINAGYEVITSFTQSEKSWLNYLVPIKQKLNDIDDNDYKSNAVNDLRQEIHIHDQYLGEYGYHLFVLKNKR